MTAMPPLVSDGSRAEARARASPRSLPERSTVAWISWKAAELPMDFSTAAWRPKTMTPVLRSSPASRRASSARERTSCSFAEAERSSRSQAVRSGLTVRTLTPAKARAETITSTWRRRWETRSLRLRLFWRRATKNTRAQQSGIASRRRGWAISRVISLPPFSSSPRALLPG